MPVCPLIKGNDPRLHMQSVEVDFQADKAILADLIDTFRSFRGSARGLAAVQIGHLKRAFAVAAGDDGLGIMLFCNPVVTQYSNATWVEPESCLSFPWIRGEKVTRPRAVRGYAFDLAGRPFPFDYADWPARIIQHENDHLDGITIELRRRVRQGTLKLSPGLQEQASQAGQPVPPEMP